MNASIRRKNVTEASREWITAQAEDPTNFEPDIDLQASLEFNNVLRRSDVIEQIWSDHPDTLMISLEDGTLIEIDVESGNSMRGSSDA